LLEQVFVQFEVVQDCGRSFMTTSVVLVNPPYPIGAPKSIFIPLGIGYLAAVLEEKGYTVDVIDCQVQNPTQRQLEDDFHRLQPDIVGVTSSTLTHGSVREIVKATKQICPECMVVLGGPHVTVLDEQSLIEQPEADVVVRGEGEQTVLELAQLISEAKTKNLGKVAGITFRKRGEICKTPDRPFFQNLDALPYPAYKHFPLDKYKLFGKTYLPIITSRGCPFQCTFCLASRMCGKHFRTRSPKNVVDELEWLRTTHGADAFAFYDDTFTFDRKRAVEICEEMKKRKMNLPWDCRTRVDQVSEKILAEMRSADCLLVHFGVESGNQKMLNAMKKGTTIEQNERAIRWAKETGILVAISVVLGYPGETPAMLQETLDFIRKTEPDYVYMCVAIPYPGTEMRELLKELGWEMSTDWDRYDEQTQVFRNPLLSADAIAAMRRDFYNGFFSPSYILHKSLKRDFYSQSMARSAINHLLWRIRLPSWVPAGFKKLGFQKKSQN
jgi:anaerobic magnesium-protoporphyrin IX monomethyl ester cyclase